MNSDTTYRYDYWPGKCMTIGVATFSAGGIQYNIISLFDEKPDDIPEIKKEAFQYIVERDIKESFKEGA